MADLSSRCAAAWSVIPLSLLLHRKRQLSASFARPSALPVESEETGFAGEQVPSESPGGRPDAVQVAFVAAVVPIPLLLVQTTLPELVVLSQFVMGRTRRESAI